MEADSPRNESRRKFRQRLSLGAIGAGALAISVGLVWSSSSSVEAAVGPDSPVLGISASGELAYSAEYHARIKAMDEKVTSCLRTNGGVPVPEGATLAWSDPSGEAYAACKAVLAEARAFPTTDPLIVRADRDTVSILAAFRSCLGNPADLTYKTIQATGKGGVCADQVSGR